MCGWVLNLVSIAEFWVVVGGGGGEGRVWFMNPPDSVCRILMYIFICFMYYMHVFGGVNPKYS